MNWKDRLLAGAVAVTVVTLAMVTSAHAYGIDLLWWLRR